LKVIITGTESQTRYLIPFDDQNYDIWVFNEAANAEWCKRWDVCFQLHKPKIYTDINNLKDPKHWEWLQIDHKKTIYMQTVDPLVPNSIRYPLEFIEQMFTENLTYNGEEQHNIRATLCYAIALALYQGVESIDIYGVELDNSAEYRSQQNNFAFWLGVARGCRIPVNLHCCKGMFNKPLYGYEDDMTEEQIQKYVVGLDIQIEEAKEKLHKLEGAKMLAIQMLTEQKETEDVEKVS
jgi:hypothetical protein